jgi:hypothetical protein
MATSLYILSDWYENRMQIHDGNTDRHDAIYYIFFCKMLIVGK